MKYVFLSIDGVMVEKNAPRRYPDTKFSKDAADALHKIVDATGAKIVVTSSWRNLYTTKAHLESMFAAAGLKVYAYIPFAKDIPIEEATQIYMDATGYTIAPPGDPVRFMKKTNAFTRKGVLIHYFLKQEQKEVGVDNYIVVDTSTDNLEEFFDLERLFNTYNQDGLTIDNANEIIKVLKAEPFWRIKKWLKKFTKQKKNQ